MSLLRSAVSNVLTKIRALPAVQNLRRKRHLSHFLAARGYGSHYGFFPTFAAAHAWLPKTGAFDRADFADEYIEIRTQRVFAYDYPVMFWLKQAFEQGAVSVFDIGGSVGVHCHAYRKYMDYPVGLQWLVCELSHAVRQGRELAAREQVSGLQFTEDLSPAAFVGDVLMAAGAIEFIEGFRLDKFLAEMPSRPKHILLNKLPLHDGPDVVSTQNIGGGAFTPHHVYNRQAYVKAIECLGYELVDAWEVPERSFFVPGEPAKSFDCYSGLYFRAR